MKKLFIPVLLIISGMAYGQTEKQDTVSVIMLSADLSKNRPCGVAYWAFGYRVGATYLNEKKQPLPPFIVVFQSKTYNHEADKKRKAL
jgi:hypothetical protein